MLESLDDLDRLIKELDEMSAALAVVKRELEVVKTSRKPLPKLFVESMSKMYVTLETMKIDIAQAVTAVTSARTMIGDGLK